MTTRNDIDRNRCYTREEVEFIDNGRCYTRPILMRRCQARPIQPRKPMHWTRWVWLVTGRCCFATFGIILLAYAHGGLDANLALPLAGVALMVGAWLCHLASKP